MTNLDQYIKEKKTIDIYKASKLAVVLFFVALIIFGTPFYFIWQPAILFSSQGVLLFSLLLVIGIVLHELIHGLFLGLFAKEGFRSIKFGVIWEYLTPYCHCNEPLMIKHYITGAVMPAILLGLIPSIVSLFIGNLLWLILGAFFISAAAGDIMQIWILRKENMQSLVQDHPSEPGCFIYREKTV